MLIVILIIIGILAGFFAWVNKCEKQYRRFIRYAKKGDPCYYYINEEKYKGKIVYFAPNQVYSYVKDITGEEKRVFSDDIYPIINYNYKKI